MRQGRESEYSLRAIAPFYIVQSKHDCYKCNKPSLVVTLAASGCYGDEEGNSEESVIFSYVTDVPDWLRILLEDEYPCYFFDWSHTAGESYYINHCEHCGVILGDFFLHSKPDGAFFLQTPEDAITIDMVELKKVGM